MQGMEDTKLFETTVRATIKEEPFFETVNLLENDSIFQQRFNQGDKTWIKANTMIDELLYVVNLLVENDHPVMITGGRESSLISKAYMTKVRDTLNDQIEQNLGEDDIPVDLKEDFEFKFKGKDYKKRIEVNIRIG